jgi:hypothetical protein
MTEKVRSVARAVPGIPASDGDGVNLLRIIGSNVVEDLDPFLLLDEFKSNNPKEKGSFPDHPHRGFETVTYMLAGRGIHGDNHGNRGQIEPGAVQWMTAGRGIVHSETVEPVDGRMHGFQLWVNLPASDKMKPVRYQEFKAAEIPAIALPGGGTAHVIAGRLGDGVAGPVKGIATDPLYWDVELPANATFEAAIPKGYSAFVYVISGSVTIGGTRVVAQNGAILTDGSKVSLSANQDQARMLVIGGRPLREPVARYGPFVMNTREEIVQAFADFREGRF